MSRQDATRDIAFNRPWVDDSDIERVVDVLRSGWWTTGALTREFEARFADYIGTSHAVALNSCTAALHVALVALGVGEGDLVVTSTLTFAATAEVAVYLGAIPVLLDAESETLNLSPAQLRALLEALASDTPAASLSAAVDGGLLCPGTVRAIPEGADITSVKALIPVHFAGQACEMGEIGSLAASYGIPIVEDAAHAVETTYRGQHAGTMGAVGAFSFYATKNLSTGEGGMATTDNPDLASRMRSLSLHGISKDAWKRYTASGSWRYDITEPGFKYNMTDVSAALGVGQLGRIEALHERRERIVEAYNARLSGMPGLTLPQNVTDGTHAWHLFVVRVVSDGTPRRRDAVIEDLRQQGVGTSVHFIPLHLHSYYEGRFGYQSGDFPVAEHAFNEIMSLPLYPSLNDDEVAGVATALASALQRVGQRV